MPKKDESLARAKTQALYVCALPAFVVFCSVAQATGNDAQAWLWAGLIVAVTAPFPLATLVAWRRGRRSDGFEAWAAANGWRHVRASSVVPRSGRDVLRAVRDGVEVASYETIAAPDLVSESPLLTRHAVAATVPGDLPTLIVLPETVIREPGAARTARDIQFESAAFNARWRVHCADDRFAHAFCHPRVMERLMRPDADGVSLLVDGRDVVVHAPGPQRLEVLDARAQLAVDLARLVPPYLLEQHPPRTTRRRVRRDEHSRVAAVLAVVLASAWVVLAVALGIAAGAPRQAIGVGGASLLLLLGFVVPALRARERRPDPESDRPTERR